MPDEGWELREPTEMERDALSAAQQWQDDIGLVVQYEVLHNGASEQVIATTSVQPQYGEEEYLRPAVVHADVDAWRAWVEREYAPSFY